MPTDPQTLSTILEDAIAIARGAGAILLEGWSALEASRAVAVEFKSTDIDPVTEFDLRSEQFIVGELRRLYPGHRIVGEEGGAYEQPTQPDGPRHVWHVDPLDGTVNFAHGFPLFCVSLGLYIEGQPAVAVVYNPALGQMYAAARGLGATCNGRPMHVSATPDLRRALLITGFAYDTHVSDSNMGNFLAFQHTAQATRRIGSAALNLCFTAAGQMDGHWEMKVKPYDIAAGILLVREAGGTVTDFDGGDDMLASGRIVASNGLIHQAMLDVLRSAGDRD